MAASKNGKVHEFNIGKNATIREILAEAKTFMTPQEYREFSRKPKTKNGISMIDVPKGATKKEIAAALRKSFTAWDVQRATMDGPTIPSDQVLAEMEEIHREETARMQRRAMRNGAKVKGK